MEKQAKKSKRGGKRPGAGRKKGARDKRTVDLEEAAQQAASKYKTDDPIELMRLMSLDPEMPVQIRLDAANKVAPYLKGKQAAIDQSKGERDPHTDFLRRRAAKETFSAG
jgi:hypothetical protein